MNISHDWIMEDAHWQSLIREVAEIFNNLTIMRGFQYYKQKRVGPLTFNESQNIMAEVQGTESYEVVLRMQALSTSYCACPVNSPCKHMVRRADELCRGAGAPSPCTGECTCKYLFETNQQTGWVCFRESLQF